MESIAALPHEVQAMTDYREWTIKTKEGVAKFMESLGSVRPSICIEGDLVFESIIPRYEKMINKMVRRAPAAKNCRNGG